MATSRYPAVVDAIVTTLQAAPALSAVTVTDGLPITEDRLTSLVIVGNSGDPEEPYAGRFEQEYHDLAGVNSTRDETVTVPCCVLAQTGDIDVSATRSSAFTILGAVESALRANYALGVDGVLRVEMSGGDVIVSQFADGTAVRLTFTITAACLI
jgi:hypothetical protein